MAKSLVVDSGLPSGTTIWKDAFSMAMKESSSPSSPQCDMRNFRNKQSKGPKNQEHEALYLAGPIAFPGKEEGWNRLPLNRRIEDPSDRLRGSHTYTRGAVRQNTTTEELFAIHGQVILSDHLGRSHVRIFRKGITPVHRRRAVRSTQRPRK